MKRGGYYLVRPNYTVCDLLIRINSIKKRRLKDSLLIVQWNGGLKVMSTFSRHSRRWITVEAYVTRPASKLVKSYVQPFSLDSIPSYV